MTPNLNADIHLSGADPAGYVVSLIPDTEVATVKAGRLTIFGERAELFALATALLDAVNLCPPFPEPTCGDPFVNRCLATSDGYICTEVAGHRGSHPRRPVTGTTSPTGSTRSQREERDALRELVRLAIPRVETVRNGTTYGYPTGGFIRLTDEQATLLRSILGDER